MGKLDPFIYSSRKDYINKNKTLEFHLVLWGLIGLISMVAIGSLCFIFPNDFFITAFILGVLFSVIALVMEFILYSDFYGGGLIKIFFKELKERRKMKRPNYQPLNSDGYKLNHIVKLENGKLFRLYQFIKPEESDKRYIYYELPKGAQITYGYNDLKETSCMFQSLNEYELADILTPISQYYINKEYREKIKKREQYINKQSKINQNITDEEINNLPLFKGFRQIENNVKKDIDSYHKENKHNIQKYQSLLNKHK
ncbi:hypothetical protein [Staphylococcus aureus]|uniref:hypothetical protein n=1 Tax=Staphylococcus aureus TaxID=1280 RepID=UPI0015E691BF|nr:hypothetical protein [Staphylococcus aureus]MBG1556442.1 hypothetical protein [Staphylococcus aureus]